MARPMNDLVVVVPGILGSELRKGDELIWGFPEGVSGLIRGKSRLREFANHLELTEDDPFQPVLRDGVRATGLISIPQVLAGFIKSDGYDLLRERLFEAFQLESCTPSLAGNYLEFPYDWRRDNRAAARRLQSEVQHALDAFRKESGNGNAKVIYICHSMGGLVARYYLDVLGGWQDCRALITLATPFRGAVNALGSLVCGYSTAGVDLTNVLRSCNSVYQLLPIYKMLDQGDGSYHHVTDCVNLPHVSQSRVKQARVFHDEIIEAIKIRPRDAYPLFYFSGVAQPTFQTAVLEQIEDRVEIRMERDVPSNFPTYRETGDGTVPYASSIPVELSSDPRGAFQVATCHAMIQSSEDAWGHIEMILSRLQDASLESVLDPGQRPQGAAQPAIQLEVEDLYLGDEVVLHAQVLNSRTEHALEAVFQRAGTNEFFGPFGLHSESPTSKRWVLKKAGLPDGVYRVKVQSYSRVTAPPAVEDVFEVSRSNL